jgi:hypothetical protein
MRIFVGIGVTGDAMVVKGVVAVTDELDVAPSVEYVIVAGW